MQDAPCQARLSPRAPPGPRHCSGGAPSQTGLHQPAGGLRVEVAGRPLPHRPAGALLAVPTTLSGLWRAAGLDPRLPPSRALWRPRAKAGVPGPSESPMGQVAPHMHLSGLRSHLSPPRKQLRIRGHTRPHRGRQLQAQAPMAPHPPLTPQLSEMRKLGPRRARGGWKQEQWGLPTNAGGRRGRGVTGHWGRSQVAGVLCPGWGVGRGAGCALCTSPGHP